MVHWRAHNQIINVDGRTINFSNSTKLKLMIIFFWGVKDDGTVYHTGPAISQSF